MPFKRPDSKHWQIRVRGVRQSADTEDFDQAKALEDKLNFEAWQFDKMGIKPPRSLKEVCARWEKEKKGKSSWHDDYRIITFWAKRLGNVPDVRTITRELIDDEAHEAWSLTEQGSSVNNTANHYVAVLTAILNAACREWDWLERSPKFRRYPILSGRTRWLTVQEWRSLEAELPVHLRQTATFSLATGMRLGKVYGLEWSQIDFGNRSLNFDGTKNKLGNTIPLNRTAMSVLSEIRAGTVVHKEAVFTRDGQPMKRWNVAWTNAMKRAGIEGFVYHGLRHTWNSWLAQKGVPKEFRDRLGGWRGSHGSDRYTHLDLDPLRPFAAQIDAILDTAQRVEKHQVPEPAKVIAITG